MQQQCVLAIVCVVWMARGAVAQLELPDGTPVPDHVRVQLELEYGKGADQTLHLDMASPRAAQEPRPCIVMIHGGAWRSGDRQAHLKDIVKFAERGYVAATVQYRLCPQHKFPAQIEDVKCAVRYLRAHADQYQIDPKRIAAVGFSAGAHLAMLLGTMGPEDGLEGKGGWQEQSSQVQVVVAFAGPTALDAPDIPEVSRSLLRDFLGGTREEAPQQYRQASPITYVSSGDAVMLLFQGTKDPLVPYTQAYRMIDKLTEAGVEGRAEILIGAAHGWGEPERTRTYNAMYAFLDRHLRPPSRTAP